ncbi:hypothetical protein ES703_77702 [subsurface metagenome]
MNPREGTAASIALRKLSRPSEMQIPGEIGSPVSIRISYTSPDVSVALNDSKSAQAPATYGQAIDVPDAIVV